MEREEIDDIKNAILAANCGVFIKNKEACSLWTFIAMQNALKGRGTVIII